MVCEEFICGARMITVSQGKKIADPSWVGMKVECGECGYTGILESKDRNLVERGDGDVDPSRGYWVKCPNCDEDICFYLD